MNTTKQIRESEPDSDPQCPESPEIITVTGNSGSELDRCETSRFGRKRRRTANYNRWKEDEDDCKHKSFSKAACTTRVAGRKAPAVQKSTGLLGLKKRTPCPNVVAGKDGIIRSAHHRPKSSPFSNLPEKGGVLKGEICLIYAKEETTEMGKLETRRQQREVTRNNPSEILDVENRESPHADREARPIFLQREPPRTRHNAEIGGAVNIGVSSGAIQVDPDTVDGDFEIFDVTDIVVMTGVMTNDSDSGVCLGSLSALQQRDSGMTGGMGQGYRYDSGAKTMSDLNQDDNSQDFTNWKIESLKKENAMEEMQEDEDEIEKRTLDIQYALIADQDGDRPIHMAVVHQDVLLVRKLCYLMKSVGASIDTYNYLHQTPLHLAVILKDPHLCEALLEEGAQPHLRDRNGDTALHLAVKFETNNCLKVLQRSKCTKNILNERNYEGLSCLHIILAKAASSTISSKTDELLTMAYYLVKIGCDINIQEGKSGRTPLINAVISKKSKIVKFVISLGANILTTDYAGNNALQVANELENRDIATLLEAKLACYKYK